MSHQESITHWSTKFPPVIQKTRSLILLCKCGCTIATSHPSSLCSSNNNCIIQGLIQLLIIVFVVYYSALHHDMFNVHMTCLVAFNLVDYSTLFHLLWFKFLVAANLWHQMDRSPIGWLLADRIGSSSSAERDVLSTCFFSLVDLVLLSSQHGYPGCLVSFPSSLAWWGILPSSFFLLWCWATAPDFENFVSN
jgi:hypothetical protein